MSEGDATLLWSIVGMVVEIGPVHVGTLVTGCERAWSSIGSTYVSFFSARFALDLELRIERSRPRLFLASFISGDW